MKKFLLIISLIPILVLTFPLTTKSQSDEDLNPLTVGDEGDVDATSNAITLKWAANSEQDIAGYNVYYGRSSGDYMRLETVVVPKATIAVKGHKTVYFAVTAFNTNGEESAFSEEVHWPQN